MSQAELKRIVDSATQDERQFLFVCLSEKLSVHSRAELEELDRRAGDLEAGKNRLSLEEFEHRLEPRQKRVCHFV